MDSVTIKAKGIYVTVDLAVGHLADMVVETGGRTLSPLHRAPWIDEPQGTIPADFPAGSARLSGDFLCAPFSRSDVEEAPLHGWPANSRWDLIDTWQRDGESGALFRLQRKVMGATVEKRLTLRDGHPFLYQEHGFIGGSGGISVAHHAMTVMAKGGRLAFSPKRIAATGSDPLEPDPTRGRFLLAYPAQTQDLTRFPTNDGGTLDLTKYAMDRRHEDFVTLVEAEHEGPGWTAVARAAEKDLVLVLKNPAELPVTMLWISNGGRDYAPWNGRHRGVIGIEDGRAAVGHAASLGDNWLKRQGIPTAFELADGRRAAFRQIIGSALQADGNPPRDISVDGDKLAIEMADGSASELPFDGAFLREFTPL
ncbi:hypothetical protein [Mesorhizobium sp. BE184]|uniref:hypothetical protein n=1 Tax=Mesorhizobium sp. BE184 TaxID=2817714 RepID=UPI0028569F27|nr:hypothetical protein [Mesorhizobium sp. BE184]MDR7033466.1 hypothetical protein [Mesorhizobium sp. BE184]